MAFQITTNFVDDAMESKQSDYDNLVLRRKKCRACEGLCNPGSKELRKFDSDRIGPWTRLHGDLNASLMVVGQDWGDVNYYLQNSGLDKLNNPTMKNLQLLLNHIGMDVCMTEYGNPDAGLFLTNAVLCLKSGGMQAAIDPTWVTNCQNRFLKQQIEIVRPAVVVALGAKAFHASLQCFGFDKIQLSDAIVDKTGIEIVKGVRLFAAYHCGAGTINRNRNLGQQKKDWQGIGKALGCVKS
jgi:DNA polymerase